MLCSIGYNNIGDTGASALAAILKETMISNLECAATLKVFAFLSAPIDTTCFPWQFGQQPALRPHPLGERHLHRQGYH